MNCLDRKWLAIEQQSRQSKKNLIRKLLSQIRIARLLLPNVASLSNNYSTSILFEFDTMQETIP
jgi:hypothetical protein